MHRHDGVFAGLGRGNDLPAVLPDDFVRQGQPQPRVPIALLRGEEGTEDLGHDLRRHAHAVVADRDRHALGRPPTPDSSTPVGTRLLRDPRPLRHGVAGIGHQVGADTGQVLLHRDDLAQARVQLLPNHGTEPR